MIFIGEGGSEADPGSVLNAPLRGAAQALVQRGIFIAIISLFLSSMAVSRPSLNFGVNEKSLR